MVGQNFSAASTYVAARRAHALSQLPPPTPFAITSNGGADFASDTNRVTLSGVGWLDVAGLELNGAACAVTWTTLTNWTLSVALGEGANTLTVQAVDTAGLRPPHLADVLIVTNTGPPAPRPVVINEWMADNAAPGGLADPADGLCQDWFELFNPNTNAVDLGGFYLTDDLALPTKFLIPSNTVIAAGGFLLVWADEECAQNSLPGGDLHVNFRLSAGGEALGLFAPDGASAQHAVTFPAQHRNVSQGLFPDGALGATFLMTNWTPRSANRLDVPPPPSLEAGFFGPDGAFSFQFAAMPGRLYEIQFTETLDAPGWIPLATLRAVGGALTAADAGAAQAGQRFYRVVLLP